MAAVDVSGRVDELASSVDAITEAAIVHIGNPGWLPGRGALYNQPMQPRVTLVVVPRERFSRTEISLESIYRNTAEPFKLIYLGGHSPRHMPPVVEYKLDAHDSRTPR